MLTSLNSHNKIILASRELENTKDFRCKYCGGKLILKKGNIKTPHFAHMEKCQCDYDNYIKEKCGGESELHYTWKLYIKNQMEQLEYVEKVDLEVKIGNRIADIVVYLNDKDDKDYREENKFIVEIQLSKINIETVISRSNDYIKEGYTDSSIYWLMGEKNRQLALNTYSGILENEFKIYLRGYTDTIQPLREIVDLDEGIDIFQDDECNPLFSFIEYKHILEFKEKLKLCRKLARDINNKKLDILNVVDVILEGKELRRKQNIYNDKILELQKKKDFDKMDSYFIDRLKIDKAKVEEELNDTIKKYNAAKEIYINKYNINIETLKNVTNQIIELKNEYGLTYKILDYSVKDESISDWQPWDDSIHIDDKKEINKVFIAAKNVYEIEHKEICLYKNTRANDPEHL